MRYVITGGSGYIGSRLVEFLLRRPDTEAIVLADVRPPRFPHPRVRFARSDVRDRAGLEALLRQERPDALVHLAFILNPIRDEALMYDVDVNGTHNALEAATAAGTEHVLVTSSTTAYGAWPDNPEPLHEEDPVRGMPDFPYAQHKTEADRVCQLWAARHPERTMTIVRPCIVLGPNVDNYISRTWQSAPFLPVFRGESSQPVQFVHENDLAEAVGLLLVGRHAGAFNVTGDGTMTWAETARMAGLKVRTVPWKLWHRVATAMWAARVPGVEAPPGNLAFLRWPWVASNEKAKRTLDWTPRGTREVFAETLWAKGLGEAGPGVATAPSPAPVVLPPAPVA